MSGIFEKMESELKAFFESLIAPFRASHDDMNARLSKLENAVSHGDTATTTGIALTPAETVAAVDPVIAAHNAAIAAAQEEADNAAAKLAAVKANAEVAGVTAPPTSNG